MKPLHLCELTSLETGLSQRQAASRPQNLDPAGKTKPARVIIRQHVLTFFNAVNFVLAFLVLLTGRLRNLLFLFVVIGNTAIGLYQELKSKKVLDAMAAKAQKLYPVLRDGQWQQISMSQIALGDIVELENGNVVPCDGVIRQGSVEVSEAVLTGESDAFARKAQDGLYGGSVIVQGKCLMQAVQVGEQTLMHEIMASASQTGKYPSQLRDAISAIIRFCTILLFPIGLLLFARLYFVSHQPLDESILSMTAAMVGMIPEGLVILTSMALAASSMKLARKNVLIQELYCIENLARTDILCLDKTGTITSGKMHVAQIVPADNTSQAQLESMLADLYFGLEDENLTAQAIQAWLKNQNLQPAQKPLETFPFNSTRKTAGAMFESGLLAAGAFDYLCKDENEQTKNQVAQWASQGYRVIAIASAPEGSTMESASFALRGFVLIEDEIRPDAKKTMDYFARQHVKIKVISGDDPQTVAAIARRAGIAGKMVNMSVVSDEELPEAVASGVIFGRVSPVQKKQMVLALKNQGHTVAMTGDGVNDVMALKEADCSIAMASGSQAASSIASLVLLKNQFGALPSLVREGRRVVNNIQRTSSLFLVKTLFSVFLGLLSTLFLGSYPFLPIQLTLVSSLGTGFPSFVLTFEPNTSRIRGSFLVNVLSRAIPGALALSAGIVMASVLFHLFPGVMNEEHFQSFCTALAAWNAMMVLYFVCRPFSPLRRGLWLVCASGFAAAFGFLPSLFSLQRLGWMEFFLLALTALAQSVCLLFLRRARWKKILNALPFLHTERRQKRTFRLKRRASRAAG